MLSIATRMELKKIQQDLQEKLAVINRVLDIDYVESIPEEQPIKKAYRLARVKKEKKIKITPVKSDKKKWSNKYDECIDCGLTTEPYKSNGRCKKCYNINSNLTRKKTNNGKKIVINKFRCNDCDHTWDSMQKFDETTQCPECNSTFVVQK